MSTKKKTKSDSQKKELLRKRCVKLAKQIAAERDGWICRYCGVGRPQRMTHEHHIFHEGLYRSMSADPDNLLTLCASHHQGGLYMRSNDKFNFHNSPRESTEWVMETMPELYQRLKLRSWESPTCTMQFWEKKYQQLKGKK